MSQVSSPNSKTKYINVMFCFQCPFRIKMFHSAEVSEVKYTLLCCVLILE